jgi:hypothetical protein
MPSQPSKERQGGGGRLRPVIQDVHTRRSLFPGDQRRRSRRARSYSSRSISPRAYRRFRTSSGDSRRESPRPRCRERPRTAATMTIPPISHQSHIQPIPKPPSVQCTTSFLPFSCGSNARGCGTAPLHHGRRVIIAVRPRPGFPAFVPCEDKARSPGRPPGGAPGPADHSPYLGYPSRIELALTNEVTG